MFQINDTVVYGTDGICRITGVTERTLGDCTEEYYVLESVFHPALSIFVPIHNEKLFGKLRRVLSAEEVRTLIHSMPQEESLWIEDDGVRKETYRKIILSGDREGMIRMIKTLFLRQRELAARGKKLHQADERFFREAEKLLYEEFALVLELERDQVAPFILQELSLKDRKG